MLPLVLDPAKNAIGLTGSGVPLERRRASLAAAGVTPVAVGPEAGEALAGLRVLYIAGLESAAAELLAQRARRAGVLVNVEDVPALCDFHVPAEVRRGDLLLTVSSGGGSPGLVRLIREWLAARFGREWSGRLDEAKNRRADWQRQGLPPSEILARTRVLAAEWLSWGR